MPCLITILGLYLQARACDVEGMRDKMFSGSKINFTEVLHAHSL